MTFSSDPARALALGDDTLVMSQRLVEWVARAPEIEEDVALANIALDLLGQARMLLTHAGSLMEPPRTEDDLAYWRDAADFRNTVLVEREVGDFAVTMVRLLLFSASLHERYRSLVDDPDATLAAIAAKGLLEVRYHRDHARTWVLRLGDGTPESHRRAQDAVDAEWPFAGPEPDGRRWAAAVLAEATLEVPAATVRTSGEGHTPALDALLAELHEVARAHPGASW